MTAITERARGAVTELPRLLPPPGSNAGGRPGGKPAGTQGDDWYAHAGRHGGLPYRDQPGVLLGDIEAAGLTGRGGAAFPVHRKLRAVLDAAGRRRAPVVIANGAESEPASDKDASVTCMPSRVVLLSASLLAVLVL